MTIAVCGSSGFIGTKLSSELVKEGHEVIRITRVHFKDIDILSDVLSDCEAVINLCGAPIIKKWDEAYKHELYVSRIETTKKLVKAITLLEKKPLSLISVSSVSIYKDNLVHDDKSVDYSTDYLALLAKEWEHEALKVKSLGLRTIILRLGAVLGKDGGFVNEIKFAFKIGLGAVPGKGTQPFPWVHIDDVVKVLKEAIKSENMEGVYNVVAPEIVNMKTIIDCCGKILHRPVLFSVSESVMKYRYGEGSKHLLSGSFVKPAKLDSYGYEFCFKNLEKALKSLL